MDYKDYEIIILPDKSFNHSFPASVRVIPTGEVTPPFKRDIGAKEAKGEILAFIDDDAYPDRNWLNEAIKIFKEDDNIGCVCGPAVTPSSDGIKEKASGLVYSSFLVSGNHIYRYLPKKRRESIDFPSCNFLIRKSLFLKIGGFEKPYWPGEDTFLCLKILKTGKKIIYDPKVLVYHHRRPLFKAHLKQIRNYAFHRGYFVKRYPENSLRIEYFFPSFFVIGIIGGFLLSLYFTFLFSLYIFILFFYLFLVLTNSAVSAFQEKVNLVNKIKLFFLVSSGIILTHLFYGIYFIKGLLTHKMPEE